MSFVGRSIAIVRQVGVTGVRQYSSGSSKPNNPPPPKPTATATPASAPAAAAAPVKPASAPAAAAPVKPAPAPAAAAPVKPAPAPAAPVKPAAAPAPKVGPGASKDGAYKNPEYYTYDAFSYYNIESEMKPFRLPQPSSQKK